MGDQDIHEQCTAHSGMETKNRTILWLLGILIALMITIGGAQFAILLDVKAQIAGYSYRMAASDEADKGMKDRLQLLEQRLQDIERRINAERHQ